jgi:N-acetylmuramoyl-L-alanine amidase
MQRTDIICAVDPGHGGANIGATSPGGYTREEDLVLAIGLRARDMAPDLVLTRDDDLTIRYRDRATAMVKKDVSLVIGIHADSWPKDPRVHGLRAYYYHGNERTRDLAKFAVLNAPEPLRGGKILADTDSTSGVRHLCRVYPMDFLLLELGFFSNRQDLRFLISQDGIDACARLVVACSERYKSILGGAENHGRASNNSGREP